MIFFTASTKILDLTEGIHILRVSKLTDYNYPVKIKLRVETQNRLRLSRLRRSFVTLLFANDAMFINVGPDTESIQNNLNALSEWLETNQTPFKIHKRLHVAIKSSEKKFYFGKHKKDNKTGQSNLG